MDDSLILNFLRLVRNGRNPLHGCEVFTFGDLKMLDNGPYRTDEEGLRRQHATRGHAAEVALVVHVKGSVAEVWRFRDLRVSMEQPAGSKVFSFSGVGRLVVSEQQAESLKMLVRIVFAYLRIHELFVVIEESDPQDVVVRLVIDTDNLPRLERDTYVEKVWTVEKLISVKVAYNALWRASIGTEVVLLGVNNTATTTREYVSSEQRVGSAPRQGSESLGSGRLILTPPFAFAPFSSSIGSNHLSQRWFKSLSFGLSDNFLPCATTAVGDSTNPHLRTSSQLTMSATVAVRGTCTPAVRGFSFAKVPTFSAAEDEASFGDESGPQSVVEQLYELLDVCDNAVLKEAHIDIFNVLDALEKTVFDM